MYKLKAGAFGIGFLVGFVAIALSGVAGCGAATDEPDPGITKEQAARMSGKADGWDYCAWFGWYGDGECDTFCPEPDPDCEAPRPTDHRPFCDPDGPEGAGWYWGDTGELVAAEECAGLPAPTCCLIGSRSQGWCVDDEGEQRLLVWDNQCHQTVRISLWGEPCGPSIGYSCYEGQPLWCQGLPDEGVIGGSGICRDYGYCETVADCEDPDNLWGHARCIGYATCEENRCVWHCDQAPEGPWSWTTVQLADVASDHPYGHDQERQWVVDRPGAERIKIHFSRIEVEAYYDWLTVYGEQEESALYLDGEHDDLWTPVFEGDTIILTLVTDYSVALWGFRADAVSYYEQLPYGRCNRNADCGPGQTCIPATCVNPYEACYGSCGHDDRCDDGTEPMCDIVPPVCPDGTILAHQNHCFSCVDPETCLEPGGDGQQGDPCEQDQECAEHLYCKSGICRAYDWCDPASFQLDCANVHHIAVPGHWSCVDHSCRWIVDQP